MPLAAGKDEMAIVHALDVPSQERLNILLRVFVNLLEFVDCHDARAVGILQILENLFKGVFRLLNIAKAE